MAELVLTNAQVKVNGVDLSDHVTQVKIVHKAELQDDTAMSMGTRSRTPGLLDWSITIDFKQDFAASKVDATLFPLVGAAAFAVDIQAVAGARSTTNPSYNGNAVLGSHDPISGQIGKLLMNSVVFEAAGPLSRSLG